MRTIRAIRSARRHGVARKLALGIAVALAPLPTSAMAGTLASGILASNEALSMICHVTNLDLRPVVVTSARILNLAGLDITVGESCGTLAPGASCLIVSQTTDSGRGAAEVAASTRKMRGACQLLDSRGVTLDAIEMR
jgi:hypothetical protein